MKRTLTVEQALAEGYTHYCFSKDGFQGLSDLREITPSDLSREDVALVDRTPYHPNGLSAKDIADLIADKINDEFSEWSGDDTDNVYHTLRLVDCSDVAKRMQDTLNTLNYYKQDHDVALIP